MRMTESRLRKIIRSVLAEAMASGGEFLPGDWKSFAKSIDEWRRTKKSYSPDTSVGSGVTHKVYNKIWGVFWSSYSGNNEILLGSNSENCVDNFFSILKKVYRDGSNKSLFNKAFLSLGGEDKPKIAALVVGMIFDDFMHNMRGGSKGYCWDTKKEGDDIFKKFQVVYRQLINKGFDKDGGCRFLS